MLIILGGTAAMAALMFVATLVFKGIIWVSIELADGAWWGSPLYMALATPAALMTIAGMLAIIATVGSRVLG